MDTIGAIQRGSCWQEDVKPKKRANKWGKAGSGDNVQTRGAVQRCGYSDLGG